MKYKNYLKKIYKALQEHKATVDSLTVDYMTEKEAFESMLVSMRGKYTDSYIAESRKNWKPYKDYTSLLNGSRSKNKAVVEYYLGLIQKQLDNYFNAPVKNDFSNKILTIKASGLQLTDREFSLLEKQATSYMERRLLNELATTRTRTEKRLNTDTGEVENVTVHNGTSVTELPNIDLLYRSFEDFKNSCLFMCNSYCGESAELVDYLGTNQPNYLVVNAGNVLSDNSVSKHNFEVAIEKASSIMPEVKTELTDADRYLIDQLVDVRYPSLIPSRIEEISKGSPELNELLSLDERYSKYVPIEVE